jgi:hypothetical protein
MGSRGTKLLSILRFFVWLFTGEAETKPANRSVEKISNSNAIWSGISAGTRDERFVRKALWCVIKSTLKEQLIYKRFHYLRV